jgi:transforming growth factor-beta-induced protein
MFLFYHQILLPTFTTADIACSVPAFSILCEAAKATGVAETLAGDGPFTVFAPTNNAFRDLVKVLTGKDGNPLTVLPELVGLDGLTNILLYHAVTKEIFAADLPCPDGFILTALGEKSQV